MDKNTRSLITSKNHINFIHQSWIRTESAGRAKYMVERDFSELIKGPCRTPVNTRRIRRLRKTCRLELLRPRGLARYVASLHPCRTMDSPHHDGFMVVELTQVDVVVQIGLFEDDVRVVVIAHLRDNEVQGRSQGGRGGAERETNATRERT